MCVSNTAMQIEEWFSQNCGLLVLTADPPSHLLERWELKEMTGHGITTRNKLVKVIDFSLKMSFQTLKFIAVFVQLLLNMSLLPLVQQRQDVPALIANQVASVNTLHLHQVPLTIASGVCLLEFKKRYFPLTMDLNRPSHSKYTSDQWFPIVVTRLGSPRHRVAHG